MEDKETMNSKNPILTEGIDSISENNSKKDENSPSAWKKKLRSSKAEYEKKIALLEQEIENLKMSNKQLIQDKEGMQEMNHNLLKVNYIIFNNLGC